MQVLAGRPAARLAHHLAIPVSQNTLLRLLRRRSEQPRAAAPRVPGVDDLATRKGRVYATILKVEFVHRHRFATRAEARIKVATWIADFYNTHRRHSANDGLAPITFERQIAEARRASARAPTLSRSRSGSTRPNRNTPGWKANECRPSRPGDRQRRLAELLHRTGELAHAVVRAHPDDEADLYAELGLTMTYDSQKQLAEARAFPASTCANGLCPRGDTRGQHMARRFTVRRAVPHSGWCIACNQHVRVASPRAGIAHIGLLSYRHLRDCWKVAKVKLCLALISCTGPTR